MTFTYTSDLTDNGDYVRFHTGDVDSDRSMLSDEIITSLLAVEASKETAVIAGLNHMILVANMPDFKADWLQVSNANYVKALERRLEAKKVELGVGGISVSVTHTYRADSAQTEEPDYSEGV